MRQSINKKSGSRRVYIIALILFVAGFATLLAAGLRQNSIYFLNVSEALAMPVEELRQIRLFGTVAAEGLEYDPQFLGVRFLIADSEDSSLRIPVHYSGVVPNLFEPGAEIILEGGFGVQETGFFTARTLMTRCPSRYEKKTGPDDSRLYNHVIEKRSAGY